MEYKSLDVVVVMSAFFAAISVLGLVALTFGPWAQPSAPMARLVLTFSWVAFWMIAMVARNVRSLFEAQAHQITALQRQVTDRQPAA